MTNERIYKGESELEYYKLLDPDDDIPEDKLMCEDCGDLVPELLETADMVSLCRPCYDDLVSDWDESFGEEE